MVPLCSPSVAVFGIGEAGNDVAAVEEGGELLPSTALPSGDTN